VNCPGAKRCATKWPHALSTELLSESSALSSCCPPPASLDFDVPPVSRGLVKTPQRCVVCLALQHTTTNNNTPQHTATHRNTLQHAATHYCILTHKTTRCSILQHSAKLTCHQSIEGSSRLTATWRMLHTAIHYQILQHNATHCNTLQHTATYRNILQHTATYRNTLQHTATRTPPAGRGLRINAHNDVEFVLHCHAQHTLQYTATHCNTLQHTAAYCNILQHTGNCNTLQYTATRCNTLECTAALTCHQLVKGP